MSAPYDEAKATSATARPLQLIRNARSLVSPSGTRFWCVVEQNLEMNFRVTETIENGTIPRIGFSIVPTKVFPINFAIIGLPGRCFSYKLD
jgi:hypothetical protein